jgi:hypothetical protein
MNANTKEEVRELQPQPEPIAEKHIETDEDEADKYPLELNETIEEPFSQALTNIESQPQEPAKSAERNPFLASIESCMGPLEWRVSDIFGGSVEVEPQLQLESSHSQCEKGNIEGEKKDDETENTSVGTNDYVNNYPADTEARANEDVMSASDNNGAIASTPTPNETIELSLEGCVYFLSELM